MLQLRLQRNADTVWLTEINSTLSEVFLHVDDVYF